MLGSLQDVCFQLDEGLHTLDSDVDVILRLLCLPGVFIGFGEGVCGNGRCQPYLPLEGL